MTQTISMLEAQLLTLDGKPRTKKRSEEIRKLKQAIGEQKQKNKVAALEFELNNFSHLLFYDSDKGYRKLTGHSALIYAANVAKRIGRRANLRKDTDHYAKSEEGVVSVVLDERLEIALEAIKIKKDEALSTEHLHFFKMSTTFKESDLEKFRELLQKDSREINQMLLAKSPVPTLCNYLRDINEVIYYNCNLMPNFAKQTVGERLFEKSSRMLSIYLKLANGNEKETAAYKEIYQLMIELKSEMKTVESLRLINARSLCQLLENMVSAEKLVAKLLRNEIRKMEKN